MATSTAAEPAQTYTYRRPSGLAGGLLGLSTSGGTTSAGPREHPRFFSGVLTEPAAAAAALLAVADVARTRYHRPLPTAFRDPVVTCNGDRLRFESFSACCGVYARLDVLEPALDGRVHERGTTNVDVNAPLREALARVGGDDPLRLAVGAEELAVTTRDGAVVAKKAPLPERWLRGFAELQVITSGFDPRAELPAAEAVRFLRGLPAGPRGRGGVLWAVPAGRGLRITSRPVPGAVCLSGPDRLRTMLPLLRFARGLRVHGPPVSAGAGPSAGVWELELPGMRYVLALSPEPHRGFSGEGAALDALAADEAADDAELLGSLLSFEPRVEPGLLAERAGIGLTRARAALTMLGTAGKVGYDTAEAAFFHRELPYDPGRVMAMNPRLREAPRAGGPGHGRADRARGGGGAGRGPHPPGPFRGEGRGRRVLHLPVVNGVSGRPGPVQARDRRPARTRGGGAAMSMPRVNALSEAIKAGDAARVAALVGGMAETERRRAARDLPGLLDEIRSSSRSWGWGTRDEARKSALLVAGAGCLSGPAAAARWLVRAELRLVQDWRASEDTFRRHADLVVEATAHRTGAWRADVGRRLADRLRPADQASSGGDGALWWTCALLCRVADAPMPDEEAFTVGWVRWNDPRAIPPGDPVAAAMLPRLFEADAVGRLLARSDPEEWIKVVLARMAEGRLDRAAVLDGCLRRFLRGGAIADLRWYAELHDALAPAFAETAARSRDYLRLLPTAPSRVAELALREVRRVDEAGRLDLADFSEAVEALLFRPEQKPAKAALTWLTQATGPDRSNRSNGSNRSAPPQRTAPPEPADPRGPDGAGHAGRQAGRRDAALAALAVAFSHEAHAVQERAVRLAVRLAPGAGAQARSRVREAAAALPHDLRVRIAAAFGDVEAPAPAMTMAPSPLPPPPSPAAFPDPAGSPAELAGEFAALLSHGHEHSWRDVERFLAGLTDLAHRDEEAVRAALKEVFDRDQTAWYSADDLERYASSPVTWTVMAARAVALPDRRPERNRRDRPWRGPDWSPYEPPMSTFLLSRMREIATLVGRVPLLLATPTRTNGHLDPAVLVARLERLAAAGAEPGPFDLAQALLRLPRDVAGADPSVIARAERLTSPAGGTVASVLRAGGIADPVVERAVLRFEESAFQRPVVLHGLVRPAGDVPERLAPLWEYPGDEESWRKKPGYFFFLTPSTPPDWWPSIAPSHAELTAAHLLPELAHRLPYPDGQGTTLLTLAECDGPTGEATGAALAYGLTFKPRRERTAAVDAFLHLTARGRLPAAAVGTAVGALAAHRELKLDRAVAALGDAAAAGADAEVWTVVAAALPAVLAANADKPVTGTAALLALGVRTAEACGARGPVPEGLAETAGRHGSSRTVKEAARLHALLTQA